MTMGMLDTSFYPKNNALQQRDPLQMMSTMMGIQQQANQNRLFQQEFADKSMENQLYSKAAIDPETGLPDMTKMAQAAQGMGAGRLLPQIMERVQQQRQRQLEMMSKQLGIAKDRFDYTAKIMSPLAGKEDLNQKDVAMAFSNLMDQGFLTSQQTAQILMGMPPGGDPRALRQWVTQNYLIPTLDAQQKVNFMYGTSGMANAGNKLVPYTQMPGGEIKTSGQSIPIGLSPDSAAAPREMIVPLPGGGTVKMAVPAAAWLKLGGGATELPRNDQGLSPPEANRLVTLKNEEGQEFKMTEAQILKQLGVGGAGVAGQGVGGTATPTATGPKLGAGTQADASAKQGVELSQQADQVPTRKADLFNLRALSKTFAGGPTADMALKLKQFANTWGIPFDPKGTAGQEEFDKIASQIALKQLQTIGTGTDEKLGAAMKANPSAYLTRMGRDGIISMMLGNEDALKTKADEWQAWQEAGNGPGTYGKFSKEFGRTFNPRVFQTMYMEPKAIDLMVRDMSTKEKKQFEKDYSFAITKGWVADPRVKQ